MVNLADKIKEKESMKSEESVCDFAPNTDTLEAFLNEEQEANTLFGSGKTGKEPAGAVNIGDAIQQEIRQRAGTGLDEETLAELGLEHSRKEEGKLDEIEEKKAMMLSKSLKTNELMGIDSFGLDVQANIKEFSAEVLASVDDNSNDIVAEPVNELLNTLATVDLSSFTTANLKWYQKYLLPSKKQNSIIQKKKLGVTSKVDVIENELKQVSTGLQEDGYRLNQLFERTMDYYDDMTILIRAGELKIEELEHGELLQAYQRYQKTKNPKDLYKVTTIKNYINRLDTRIFDLQLARQVVMQQAPQIQVVMNANQSLVSKINSSILTSVPLWKNQLLLSATMERQKFASDLNNKVRDTTSTLLANNSEQVKDDLVLLERNNQLGVVSMDTVREMSDNLTETLINTLKTQDKGKEARLRARKELASLEQNVKDNLLKVVEHSLQDNYSEDVTIVEGDFEEVNESWQLDEPEEIRVPDFSEVNHNEKVRQHDYV